jgi:flagellar M-ring protein FliF
MQSQELVKNSLARISNIKQNVSQIDRKTLISSILALSFAISLIAIVLFISGRPVNEILYAGLTRQDSGRVATALRDAGIEFDLNTDGSTIYVRYGHAPRARMTLAQKGLPQSNTTGYELFEKLGTFGLTSFMQEVTKLRAIEGELSRTIQMLDGIRSARVHLVIPHAMQGRPNKNEPSASIVLQTDLNSSQVPVTAIRHLVSAAVPGMKPGSVTISGHDGTLLASQLDEERSNSESTKALEREIGALIQRNVMTALIPYVSPQNIRVSVFVSANTDKKETTEKHFLPDTKVERSIRTTRESSDTQQGTRDSPTSAQQNIPRADQQSQDERRKQEASQRREEVTNYEISTRATNTTSGGYSIERMSIAVSLNRAALMNTPDIAGSEERLTKYLNEIEQLARAAAGLKPDRGDAIKIVALQYLSEPGQPTDSPSFLADKLPKVTELIIRDIVLSILIILTLYIGIRPLLSRLFPSRIMPENTILSVSSLPTNQTEDIENAMMTSKLPQHRLNAIDELNAAKGLLIENLKIRQPESAEILKQWLRKNS